jgi:glycosyltransferase involved in cell wall biosynthesis
MRVLQVISHYVPAWRFGGPQRVAHSLGKALVDAGHRMVVCTTNLADETSDLDVPLDEPVDLDGVTVYYEPTIISRYWGFSPKLFQRVAREMPWADVALVHAHYQFANWAGAWLARRYKKPYVIFPHGSLHRQGISHKRSGVKRLYLRLLERGNLNGALFIAFNAPEEQRFSLFNERGRVIPSGIDPTEFAPMPPPGRFRQRYSLPRDGVCFLFLGRLDVQHKGLDLLIPAFGRLARQNPMVHLVLAGPDEDGGADEVYRLAKQHDVAAAITLTGLISGQEKLAALQDADAFLLPSRFEGLSIALLEALYVGLPVLVTDQVGLSMEIDRIGAGKVVTANSEAIRAALEKLADPAERAVMCGKGRDLILHKYTWDVIATGLIDELQRTMS